MTMEGPNGKRYLVRKDGSLVMDGDGYPRPIRMDELDPASGRIVRAFIDMHEAADRRKRDEAEPTHE